MTMLVTGATGHVGRRVAELLAHRGASLRLLARDPKRAPHLAGAEVVGGDYADPAGVREACAGVSTAFVVSVSGPPGESASLHASVFTAAASAGVEHVVYLACLGASRSSCSPVARDHRASEEALAATGMRFTVLRGNLYLDALPEMVDLDGVLRAPAGEGAAAFVAREDVARVVAAAMTAEPTSDRALDVTGPEALSLRRVVERLSTLTGLDLTYEDEPLDKARARRRELGEPDWQVEAALGSSLALAAGELERPSDTVRRLTGREPLDLEGFVRAHPQAFAHLRPDSAG
jgi:NAD(P)H dehydrogenase (quinone)